MKVALVHDALNQYGGAERVLDEFHAMFPDAPVYTSIYDPKSMPARYREWDIRPTWLNRLPFVNRKHQLFLPLFPLAFESINLSGYDLVLSSSFGFSHGVITDPDTCHVSYCHSPPRYLWDYFAYVQREGIGRQSQRLLKPLLYSLRTWDRASADRVDYYISVSRLVQTRIAKFYRRRSVIIPPPVDVTRFRVDGEHDGYYLMLMRLVGWKRPDIAVRACTRLGLPLVVAGDGRKLEDLKRIAGPTIRFVGRVGDVEMKQLYARCKAFILPAEEDFGITPLEAMAAGRPVIAYGAGGALDTVDPGVTGTFFPKQSTQSLADVLETFDADAYDPARIRAHAETFDSSVFRERVHAEIERCLSSYRVEIPTAVDDGGPLAAA